MSAITSVVASKAISATTALAAKALIAVCSDEVGLIASQASAAVQLNNCEELELKYNAPVNKALLSLSTVGAELFAPKYLSSKLSNAASAAACAVSAAASAVSALLSAVSAAVSDAAAAFADDNAAAALVVAVAADVADVTASTIKTQ